MTIIVPNYVKNDTFCIKFIFELIIDILNELSIEKWGMLELQIL